jgi:hypothetical protein
MHHQLPLSSVAMSRRMSTKQALHEQCRTQLTRLKLLLLAQLFLLLDCLQRRLILLRYQTAIKLPLSRLQTVAQLSLVLRMALFRIAVRFSTLFIFQIIEITRRCL